MYCFTPNSIECVLYVNTYMSALNEFIIRCFSLLFMMIKISLLSMWNVDAHRLIHYTSWMSRIVINIRLGEKNAIINSL